MPTKVLSFLQEAKAEFKRVTWPSKKKTTRLTAAVLTVTVGTALLIAFLDYVFSLAAQALIKQ